jgi:hypothetical protein
VTPFNRNHRRFGNSPSPEQGLHLAANWKTAIAEREEICCGCCIAPAFRRSVYFQHGTPLLPPTGDGRNTAGHASLDFSAQSHKGRPSRRQSRWATTRIQDRLGCSPIVHRVFIHCRDSRFQVVVRGGGSVVGNVGVFYLPALGLAVGLQYQGRHASPEVAFYLVTKGSCT